MSTPKLNVFARITKVDEEKRLVFGRAAEEKVDKAGEVMDYMASKPHFQKWSADVQADTGGKSMGNLRAMHGKVAAGRLDAIDFNDAEKAVDVCAKVVDDQEWKKVLEGVYTGFSIGGNYADKKVEKMDGREVTRYTAVPSEISLVDRPCMSGAKFFEVQKADGTLAKVEFKAQPDPDDAELEVKGEPEDIVAMAKAMQAGDIDAKTVVTLIEKHVADKAAAAEAARNKPADIVYADPVAKRWPLDTDANIRAAWHAHRADGALAKALGEKVEPIVAAIANAWVEKIDNAGPPAPGSDLEKAALAEFTPEALAKRLQDSTPMADAVAALQNLVKAEGFEAANPRVRACIALCGAALQGNGDLVKVFDGNPVHEIAKGLPAEEAQELAKAMGFAPATDPAAEGGELVKTLQAQLAKVTSDIELLKSQPAATRVALRAVPRGAEVIDTGGTAQEIEKVMDGAGKPNDVATLIKSIHQQGGAPLQLRK